jgi:photosystem II stability/assembly factor-like uncharacterized protein
MKLNRYTTPIFVLLVLAGCKTAEKRSTASSLERKAVPYDHLTLQRTYPDTVFDWRAWRRLLANAEQASTAEERGVACNTNTVISNTPWTLQGPANHAGRVNSLAVQPGNENVVLAGFGGGGLFRTTDAGNTWTPVFDQNAQLSIGCVVFDPSNPDIAYTGTGDANMPSILYNGDGVFKSTDAGLTWQYFGLQQAGVVSKIVVHPTDPKTIWVATMGNPYVRNTERGVYKTTDGGITWQKTLFVSNHSGCSSLVMSAADPQILYASFWNRIRNSTESFVAGPSAKVFKSTDGGTTWTQLGGGLPTHKNGRTGLAISQQNPNKVYALFIDTLSTTGSLHLTTDGGATWSNLNVSSLEDACADFGWYFGKMSLHPTNDNDLYFHGILLHRRLSNGTWQVASGGHADSHDLAFCPSGRRYWANDGGVYRNEPGQMVWTKSKNLPATQAYRVGNDPQRPNDYWIGSQDNGVKRGNANTLNNWAEVIASDGFSSAFHQSSTDTFWVETQNGSIWQTNNNGANWSGSNNAFGTTDRVGWDAPFFRSIHPPHLFYGGTYRVLTSPNGLNYAPNSPDLSNGVTIAPRFHVVSHISESPLQAGKLFACTSDANVWWRSTAGTWTNITGGLPNRYVTSVVGSPTMVNRIFVTHSGFRDNENIPHIHRSDNNGQTWTNISGNMPQVPVNQLFVVPNTQDSVLVAGTDAGVFATKNGGISWYRLGTGLPSVPVFDFKHNTVNKVLAAALHGRGIYTFPIDSIAKVQQQAAPTTVAATGLFKDKLGRGLHKVSFPGVATTASDTTGFISLVELPGCTTTVFKPSRNDFPYNGLSSYDLVLISRHILNLEPLSTPYKLIAADANKSKTVTNFDIVQLRKILLGTDTAFTDNESWRFVRSDYQFSGQPNPLLDPFPEADTLELAQSAVTIAPFTGLKVGDLDGDANPYALVGTEDRNLPIWPVWAKPHDPVTLTIGTEGTDLSGVQFELEFDSEQLSIERIVPHWDDMNLEEHFNLRQLGAGRLAFVYEPQDRPVSGFLPLFDIVFGKSMPDDWQSHVRIARTRLPARAFDRTGTPSKAVLVPQPDAQGTDGILLFPNPGTVSQGIWGTSAIAGTLQVLDVYGRVVAQHTTEAGQTIRLQPRSAGVYSVVLRNGNGQWVRKFVVTE